MAEEIAGAAPFEYDPEKSQTNRLKHGIDFDAVLELWNDPFAIEMTGRSDTESRSIAIGQIEGKIWSVVFTLRGDKIRIISARRARKNEEMAYEKNIGRRI
jgi:uncharacterized DUF497 family protein